NALARRKARREVLRWFARLVLAEMDERAGVVACYEALRARPDLPRGQALLGLALARQGQLDAAREHLSEALQGSPFVNYVAAALAQVLQGSGRQDELRALQAQRRLLHKAAPTLVPLENWFSPTPLPPATPVTPGNSQVQPGRNGTVASRNGTHA